MYKKILFFLQFIFLFYIIHCSKSSILVVQHQVTGPTETNTYLVYEVISKEAALVDVGGPIDSLESVISENNLNVKYIFITHAHCDHVESLPAIMEKYPQAKICLSKEEYEDLGLYSKWESVFDPNEVAEMKKYPAVIKMANFDYSLIGEPDIFLEDNKFYPLGDLNIKAFLSPGHSRGSMCLYVENVLFSGDVLFYRSAGRTDFPKSGGRDELVKSVQRLYHKLPDQTIVYTGHGPFTDIGSEKRQNKKITVDKVTI